jgi:hypothetical protein
MTLNNGNNTRPARAAAPTLDDLTEKARGMAFDQGITQAQAFTRLIKANPDAYRSYLIANPQLDGGQAANRARYDR